MAEISRLRDTEISNGNLINADDLDAEFNQLVSESNSQHDRLTDIESNNLTIAGTKTFSGTVKADVIENTTSNNGIKIENAVVKRGQIVLGSRILISSVDTSTEQITTSPAHNLTTEDEIEVVTDGGTLPSPLAASTSYYVRVVSGTVITLHPTPADATANTNTINLTTTGTSPNYLYARPPGEEEGGLWYNTVTEVMEYRTSADTKQIATTTVQFPELYKNGPSLEYVSATQIKIPAGVVARDDGNTTDISVTTDITIDISAATGAAAVNRLMNGLSEAADTIYGVWLIAKAGGADPAGLLTTSHTTIATFPTNYTLKRFLGYFVNDGSSNQIPFTCCGLGGIVEHIYNVVLPEYGATVGATNVLDDGTATTFTAVDCSDYIPAAATLGYINLAMNNTNTNVVSFRPTGESHNGYSLKPNNYPDALIWMKPGTSQQYDYKTASASYPVDIHVAGFKFNGGAI